MVEGNPVPTGTPPGAQCPGAVRAHPPGDGCRGTGVVHRLPLPGLAAARPAADALIARFPDLARRLFTAPMAAVSLFDTGCGRQVIRAQSGFAGRWALPHSAPRALGFCEQVRRTDLPLAVDDARHDRRGRAFPLLADLGVVAYLGVPLHDADGHPVGVLSVIDRSPRRWGGDEAALLAALAAALDDALRLSDCLAARAVEVEALRGSERGRLAAGLGRDLHRQADAVLSLAAEIGQDPEPPPVPQIAAAIRLAGGDLLAVAEDLRDLARLEGGRAAPLSDPFVPAELLAGLDPNLRVAARARGLRIVVDVAGDAQVPRRGDVQRIRQLLDHRVAAALGRAAGGEVALRLDLGHGDRIGIEVSHAGPCPNLPGRSGDGPTPPLADLLAQARIALLGGTLAVGPGPAGGTVTRIDLPAPVTACPPPPAAVPPPGDAAAPLAGRRLLVVEGTATMRRMLSVILERAGADVAAVPDGAAAIRACAADRFDALLLDTGRSGEDGAVVLGRIRAGAMARGTAAPPVLGLGGGPPTPGTAGPDHAGGACADPPPDRVPAGCEAILPRPVDALALVGAVTRLLSAAPPDAAQNARGAGPCEAGQLPDG